MAGVNWGSPGSRGRGNTIGSLFAFDRIPAYPQIITFQRHFYDSQLMPEMTAGEKSVMRVDAVLATYPI